MFSFRQRLTSQKASIPKQHRSQNLKSRSIIHISENKAHERYERNINCGLGSPGFESLKAQDFFLDRFCGASVPGVLPGCKAAGGMNLTLHLDLVPRLRMSGSTPPLPLRNFMRWTAKNSHLPLRNKLCAQLSSLKCELREISAL